MFLIRSCEDLCVLVFELKVKIFVVEVVLQFLPLAWRLKKLIVRRKSAYIYLCVYLASVLLVIWLMVNVCLCVCLCVYVGVCLSVGV